MKIKLGLFRCISWVLCLFILLVADIATAEVADAVYRDGVVYNINYHTGLIYRYDNANTETYVIHSKGSSSYEPFSVVAGGPDGTWAAFLGGNNFMGQRCPANLSKAVRDSIISDGVDQVNAHYWAFGRQPGGPLIWGYKLPNSSPQSGDGIFRCDFLVEWCYEQNGYDVCDDLTLYDPALHGPKWQMTEMPDAIQTPPYNVYLRGIGSQDSTYPTISNADTFTISAIASDEHSGLAHNSPLTYMYRDITFFEPWVKFGSYASNTPVTATIPFPNRVYAWKVLAYDNGGNYTESNSSYIKYVPLIAPTTPTGVSASSVSSSQINLAWSDVNNETGYKIERSLVSSVSWSQIADLSANVKSYSNTTGLTAGTQYQYRIRAYNGAGNSSYTSIVSATTQPGTGTTHSLTIYSANPSSGLNVSSYVNSEQYVSGQTPTSRSFAHGTTVGVSCFPITLPSGQVFQKWQLDGIDYAYTNSTSLILNAPHTLTAFYGATPPPTRTLSSLAIEGSASVNENSSSQYKAKATFTDTSTAYVSPTWSLNSSYAGISSSGQLDTYSVINDQGIGISASYTAGGVTRLVTKNVTIFNTDVVPTYALTLNSTAGGSIFCVPNGSSFAQGTIVSVYENADPGYVFTHWSGNASGTSSSVTVQMDGNRTVTANFAVDTSYGQMQVNISPTQAVAEGAQWKYSNFLEWQNSGHIVDGITPRTDKYVYFKDIPGWITPDSIKASVLGGIMTVVPATYREILGSVQVTINPSQANTAGARWRLDGGAWTESGVPLSNVSTGSHNVEFLPVTGWATPASQTFSVGRGVTSIRSADYVPPAGLPIITAVSPQTIPISGGTAFTIYGINFTSPATVLVGGKPATNIVVVSDSQITCKAPSSSTYGSATLTVQTAGGTATSSNGFTYGDPRGSGIELVGSIGGHVNAVAAQGNYCYYGEGSSLVILNIANPASPYQIARLALPGLIYDIALLSSSGRLYALVANSDAGLQVVDITTPSTPLLCGRFVASGKSKGVAVLGGYAYLANGDNGLIALDVSDPTRPWLAGSIITGGFADKVVLKSVADKIFAYVSSGGALRIVDASVPASMILRGQSSTLTDGSSNHSLAVSDNRAFLTDGSTNMAVLDITNLDNIINMGIYGGMPSSSGIAAVGSRIYIKNIGSGMAVCDLVGGNLQRIGITFAGSASPDAGNVSVSNGYVYCAMGAYGLSIYDATTPTSPLYLKTFNATAGVYLSLTLNGSTIYAVTENNGLKVINASNSSNPTFRSQFLSAVGGGKKVEIVANQSFFVDGAGQMNILNAANPDSLVLLGTTSQEQYFIHDFYMQGNYIVAAVTDTASSHTPALAIINSITPSSPSIYGKFFLGAANTGGAAPIAGNDSIACVAVPISGSSNSSLRIINISNMQNPQQIGQLPDIGTVMSMRLAPDNRYLYVGNRSEMSWSIIDVGNPTVPVKICSNNIGSSVRGFEICGTTAYVAALSSGVLVYDISIPSQPRLIRSYKTPNSAYDVKVLEDILYVADFESGLAILKLSDIETPQVVITSPTSLPSCTNTSGTISLGGTASDNKGITRVTWSNSRGNGGVALGTTTWTIPNIQLAAGLNRVTVTAEDANGNIATDTIEIIVTFPDTSPPAVIITSPKADSEFTVDVSTITLAGTVTDDHAVAGVAWTSSSGASGTAVISGQNWTISNISLLVGPNIIRVTATDSAANSAYDTATIYFAPPDTTAPTISIEYPTLDSTYVTAAGTLDISGSAMDENQVSDVRWFNKSTGGQGVASGISPWLVNNIPLKLGLNIIEVRATDAAGNKSTDTLSVTYAPPVVVQYPYTYTVYNGLAIVTKYDGLGGALVIPGTIDGLEVAGIGDYAFHDCTDLTSVTIPASVTSVGDSAYSGCTSLAYAYFLGNAPAIGANAFNSCDPNFTVYYCNGAQGFTSPIWEGYQSAIAYTLTYSAGTGGSITGSTPQIVKNGTGGTEVTAVQNYGYHFVKWSDNVMTASRTDSNVNGNIAVTATFAINTYTVTFNLADKGTRTGGGALIQTINHRAAAIEPEVTANTGWTFTGWDVAFNRITSSLTVTAQYNVISHTVTFVEGVNGTITGTKVQAVNYGSVCTAVEAVPGIGCHFLNWRGDYSGTSNPLTITNVTADMTITANFEINSVEILTDVATVNIPEGLTNTFQVKLSAQPTSSRTVSVARFSGDSDITVTSGSSLTFTTTNWSTYQTVTLSAAQDADTANGSAVIRCSSSGMTDKDVTANEVDNDYILNVTNNGNGTTVPSGVSLQTKGAVAMVTATASTGYHFVNWTLLSGSATFANANSASTTATASLDATIRANFAINAYSVTFDLAGKGIRTGGGDLSQTINHGSAANTPNVTPNAGWAFTGWDKVFDNITAVTTVTAQYSVVTYNVTFLEGANGTITGTKIQTVNHGTAGSEVTAVPNIGYHFVNWTGDYSGTANPLIISSVNANKTVTANFAINTYALTYNAGANGSITGTTPQTVNHGANGATVTATPVTNYHFVKWSDDVMTAARTDMNITANLSVAAIFAINTYTLTYNAGANGSITGTTPQTVNHGANGSAVTATPAIGYHFVKWSDDVMTAARTDMNITANLSVTATFAINNYTVTFDLAGKGASTSGGAISQNINHGSAATAPTVTPNAGWTFTGWDKTFDSITAVTTVTAQYSMVTYNVTFLEGANGTITGTKVQTINHGTAGSEVTAVPNIGYHFVDWTGDYSGTTNPLTISNVTANKTITANFAINTYTLTYNAGANGSIAGITPRTVNHGADGSRVTATPDARYHFVSWDDGLLSASRTDTNITGNKTFTASFAHDIANLTMADNGNGTTSPAAGATVVDTLTPVAISATPDDGSHFQYWTATANALVADAYSADTTVTLTGDATVTAFFQSNVIDLVNETAVGGIFGFKDEVNQTVYRIYVPSGQSYLDFKLKDGEGDCDMYVKYNSAPALNLYNYRSTGATNAETIVINNPAEGWWYVMLYGKSDYSGVTLTATYKNTIPASPSVSATQGDYEDRITVSWNAIGNASSYEIYRADSDNSSLSTKIADVITGTTYDDSFNVKGYYCYYYWVKANNASGTSGFGSSAKGWTKEISATNLSDGQTVTLSGTAGSVKIYKVEVPADIHMLKVKMWGGKGDCDLEVRYDKGPVNMRLFSNHGNSNEMVKIDDPPAGTYYIYVSGNTDYSGVSLSVKLVGGKPGAVSGLSVSDGQFTDRISIYWNDMEDADSYEVWRAEKNDFASAEMIGEVYETCHEDGSPLLDESKAYYYWIRSKNTGGDTLSVVSKAGRLMNKPALPPNSVVAGDGTFFDRIRVSWGAVNKATSYEIYRSVTDDSGAASLVATVDASSAKTYSYDDMGDSMTMNQLYHYFIIAKNSGGKGDFSKSASGYLKKSVPASVTATKGTLYGKVRVAWANFIGATSYEVFRSDDKNVDNAKSIGTSKSLSYDDEKVDDGKTYYYWVQAWYGTAYYSNYSTSAYGSGASIVKTLAAPKMKSVSKGQDRLMVIWGEVGKAESYIVKRSEFNVYSTAGEIGTSVKPLFEDKSVPEYNKIYYYWVIARNGTFDITSKQSGSMNGYLASAASAAGNNYSETVSGGLKSFMIYAIEIPNEGATRLVVKLSGGAGDCDLFAKLGSYPTKTSYNYKGVESAGNNEIITVSNPSRGMWYVLLYGYSEYSGVTLTLDYYSSSDILLTQVPANDQRIPCDATFKGRVVDEEGRGISGLCIKARNPLTGLTATAGKTDASGAWTFTARISQEGAHTFDFFFNAIPDIAKGTASHTVYTLKTSKEANEFFDFASYYNGSQSGMTLADQIGLQTFLDIRNGWDIGAIDENYENMWLEKTICSTEMDAAVTGKLQDGVNLILYTVDGAASGNDMSAEMIFKASPLMVHVASGRQSEVLGNLLALGVIDDTQKELIKSGRIGVVPLAVLSNVNEGADGFDFNVSLTAQEQLELLANLAGNMNVASGEDRKYSGTLTKVIAVNMESGRRINVVAAGFVK